MKKLITVALSLMFVVCLSYTVIAGSLDSPGAPSGGSGMYTLQNLYDYLTSGAALTVQTSFQEPTSGPGSTMKTTKQIGDAIKDKFNLCSATVDNVEQGVTFFCTQPGSWGVRTGTLSALPRPTATPTITPTPIPTPTSTPWCEAKGGYWAATQLAAPNSMGCWFNSGGLTSCTSKCQAVGLSCLNANWNDDSSCNILKHLGATCTSSCGASVGAPAVPYAWYADYNSCAYRTSGNQDCTATETSQGMNLFRACVCIP